MKKTIRENILELIESDTDYKKSNENKIRSIFENASHSEKEKIDLIFVNLCGFSLQTILNNNQSHHAQVGLPEDEFSKSIPLRSISP